MSYTYKINPEEAEARALTQYLELLMTQGKVLAFTHVSNETYTKSWMQKSRNKAMGVRSGVPDYIIVTAEITIFLELKRPKGGVVSESQKRWLEVLPGKYTKACVAHGFDQAKAYIDTTLKRRNENITTLEPETKDYIKRRIGK